MLDGRRSLTAIFLLLFATGCGLEGAEDTFAYQTKGFDQQITLAQGDLKVELEAVKAGFTKEYAALPSAEDADKRLAALEPLNDRLRTAKWDAEKKVEAQKSQAAEVAQAEIATYQQKFVGIWKGVGMDLTLTADGGCAYKRTGGSGNTEVNAPITEFRRDSFDVGSMGITTTFKIDAPPHPVDDKVKMTIDGVELTRMDL